MTGTGLISEICRGGFPSWSGAVRLVRLCRRGGRSGTRTPAAPGICAVRGGDPQHIPYRWSRVLRGLTLSGTGILSCSTESVLRDRPGLRDDDMALPAAEYPLVASGD